MQRRLAAILAADVVGYSRLMEQDEAGTLAVLKARRKELLEPLVASHDGRIVKLWGDSALAEFASAVNAVACAVAVQKAMAAANKAAPEHKRILLRIGINLGDVIVEGEDIYGDGVNVAARLEALAEPGGIWISGKVRDEVSRKLDLAFDDLGLREVKNMAAPVRAYRVYEPGQRPPSQADVSRAASSPVRTLQRRRARAVSKVDARKQRPDSLFVGRQSEMESLQTALDDALAERGGLVMLVGEPGIGKTRIAEELADHAAKRRAEVLWGRCYEESGAPPFWPWVQAIRSYCRDRDGEMLRAEMGAGIADIADIVPEVRQRLPDVPATARLDDPAQARFRLFDSIASFLRNICHRQPVVLIFDDLHWADAPSLRLLQFLAPEVADSRLLLVGTYRDVELSRQHPLSDALGALARLPRFRRLRLSGLSLDDVGRFVAAAAGAPPPQALVDSLHSETEGNPLFLKEIVRFLAQVGVLQSELTRSEDRPEHASGRGLGIRIPEGVREVIGKRLNRLSQACNQMLSAASVIGREFALEVVLRLLDDRTEDDILEAIDEAVSAGIIEGAAGAPGHYQFTHALIRETLYEELRTARRTSLHRRIGEVLEELHRTDLVPHLPQLAHHFCEAAHSSDIDKAIEYATRAGERADALLAYEEAVRFHESALHALELREPIDEVRRCTLLMMLGEALRRANEFERALDTFQRAARSANAARSPETVARAALGFEQVYWRMGRRGDMTAVRFLEDALRGVAEDDLAFRARMVGALGRALLHSGNPEQATTCVEKAITMSRRLGEPAVLAANINILLEFPWNPEATEERLAYATEMLRLAEQVDNAELLHLAHARRAVCFFELGDIAAVDAEIQEKRRIAETLFRQPVNLYVIAGFGVTRALLRGQLAEAERLIAKVLEFGERAQTDFHGTVGIQMFTLRREQGRLRELGPAVTRFVQQHAAGSTWRPGLAVIFTELGREQAARAEFEQLAANDFSGIARDGLWSTCIAYLAEVCAYLGDALRANTLYRLLLPYADRNIVVADGVACFGSASRYLGMLGTIMARWEDAERHFEHAMAMNARMGARPWLAHTQHDYAAMLFARGQTGDREKAATLMNDALATARELGMRALEERIITRIGEPPERPRSAEAFPDELTPREVAVLRLIAIGRSNSDIAIALSISLNTVATHVRSILAKTGCANRTEAAAYAMRCGLASLS
jgi:class 3 adenylate cyclase/ATP/maltotriose-dependent transcriptional regulator MalT